MFLSTNVSMSPWQLQNETVSVGTSCNVSHAVPAEGLATALCKPIQSYTSLDPEIVGLSASYILSAMFYRSVWSARNPSLALVPEDRDQGTLRSAAVSNTEQTGLKKVKLKKSGSQCCQISPAFRRKSWKSNNIWDCMWYVTWSTNHYVDSSRWPRMPNSHFIGARGGLQPPNRSIWSYGKMCGAHCTQLRYLHGQAQTECYKHLN